MLVKDSCGWTSRLCAGLGITMDMFNIVFFFFLFIGINFSIVIEWSFIVDQIAM